MSKQTQAPPPTIMLEKPSMFAATCLKDRSQTGRFPERNRAATGMKPGSNRNEAGQHPEWARSWLGVARSSWAPLGAARMVTTRSLRGHHAVTTRSQRGHDAITTRSGHNTVTTRYTATTYHGHNTITRRSRRGITRLLRRLRRVYLVFLTLFKTCILKFF